MERSRPGGAFDLGRIEVNVTADAAQASATTTLDESEYRQRDLRTVPDALNLVPGLNIQRIGPRNERGVYIRGFDVRQVPFYMDGIPVYVPYDGYVDLDRFLMYDVSEVQIAKGFTSPLYGPNAIGGAINLISKAPTKPLNLDLGSGYGSGDEVNGFLNAGTRWNTLEEVLDPGRLRLAQQRYVSIIGRLPARPPSAFRQPAQCVPNRLQGVHPYCLDAESIRSIYVHLCASAG